MSSAFTRSRERMSVKWRRFCCFCVIFSSSSTSNDFAILLRLRNNCANKHRMRSMSLFRCNRIQDWLTVKSESCRELSCDQPQKLPKLSRKTKKNKSRLLKGVRRIKENDMSVYPTCCPCPDLCQIPKLFISLLGNHAFSFAVVVLAGGQESTCTCCYVEDRYTRFYLPMPLLLISIRFWSGSHREMQNLPAFSVSSYPQHNHRHSLWSMNWCLGEEVGLTHISHAGLKVGLPTVVFLSGNWRGGVLLLFGHPMMIMSSLYTLWRFRWPDCGEMRQPRRRIWSLRRRRGS